MKSQLFDRMDLTLIIGFIYVLKMACDNNLVHKGDATCLVSFFSKRTESAALTACPKMEGTPSHCRVETGILTSHVHVVNYLLKTYPKENSITAADARKICSTQLPNTLPIKYALAVWVKILLCPQVYHVSMVVGAILECSKFLENHSMPSFWCNNWHAGLQKLE